MMMVVLYADVSTLLPLLSQAWNDAPLVFFLPKTTDATITELAIENMVRPSVFATAVVPLDDMKRFSGGKGGGEGLGHSA